MRRISALFILAILTAACGGLKAGATKTRAADGMVMVYVPAGEFLRGSTEAQVEQAAIACVEAGGPERACRIAVTNEAPQRGITVDAFWIDRTEVTNTQYRAFVGATGHRPPTCGSGEPTYDDASMAEHPVVCVSWDDTAAYCEWAGARLPTEAEWEKAARGTDGRIYPWGNAFDGSLLNFCDRNCGEVHKDSSVDDGYGRTAPVGSYPKGASPYGALDMAGNVWEWVGDRYDEDYYATSPARNPQGPESGELRVLRGGEWGSSCVWVRCAGRWDGHPDLRAPGLGFRCAVSSAPSP